MNTGRIQDKLRDPVRLKNWYDQYALEAADTIDRLEKEIEILKADADWQTEEKNNYSKILSALGMDEESDPVAGVFSLIEKLRVCEFDRDNAWSAFQRLRKAYAMVRYPTLNEEIKLLYDTADAVAHGYDTSGDGGQNPTVTPVKPPTR